MIESLFNPKRIRATPLLRFEVFIAGFIFTMVGALFAINIVQPGPDAAGLGFLLVAFISIPAAPFFVQLFMIEERESVVNDYKQGLFTKNLFTRHLDVISIFTFFFLSVVVASSFFYVVAPPEMADAVFREQVNDLQAKGVIARSPGTGAAFGFAFSDYSFSDILFNNLVVLALAFVFSFALGAGAVFLISWNASVIGSLIGKIARYPESFGSVQTGNVFTNYLVALPVTILRLLPHGVFEFGAYFIAAIAGGVLSAGMIQEAIRDRRTHFSDIKCVLVDSLVYLGIAVVFIFVGAIIECGL